MNFPLETIGVRDMQDYHNEYGVNLSAAARKVHAWAEAQSRALGRDVTFLEAMARWLDYVHPNGASIAADLRGAR